MFCCMVSYIVCLFTCRCEAAHRPIQYRKLQIHEHGDVLTLVTFTAEHDDLLTLTAELGYVLIDELDDMLTLTTEVMTDFLARANVPANYANIARANKCCFMQRMLAQCK